MRSRPLLCTDGRSTATASHATWAIVPLSDRRRDLEQSGGQAFSFLPISRSFCGPPPEGENTLTEPQRTTQGQHGQHGQQRVGRMTVPYRSMSWPCSVPNIIPVLREVSERALLVIANLTSKIRRCNRQFRLHGLRAILTVGRGTGPMQPDPCHSLLYNNDNQRLPLCGAVRTDGRTP